MFKKKTIGIILILTIMSIVFIFSGCSNKIETSNTDEVTTKVDEIKSKGKLVLGTCADYPPYEFHKEIDNKDQIVGFDVSLAKAIAEELGVELEIKDMQFSALLAALKTDKVDIVIAGMTPDEERMKEVDFSKIYYNAEHSIAIKAEDKEKFETIEDLKGKVIGVQKGAIQEDIAKEQIPDSQLKGVGKVTDLMLQLKNGRVDAVVVEDVVGKAYVNKNDDLYLMDEKLKDEDGGSAIAINKGNVEFLESINKIIDKLIEENKIDEFVVQANEMVDNE